ncbi:MAG: kynureninase [Gammaproteobacteria bacterium]|nr:kynureninase [Gammaproteobacteria bacterium]MDE2347157.1 kynureninase [Gammaproteobacteria bacterium]
MTADAAALDAADPLAPFADEFHHPLDAAGRRAVYLCGHSLGLQPRSAARYVEEELAAWRDLAVRGHHEGPRPWIQYHEGLSAPLAALAGAGAAEVVAMNSLTVNLHLMMVSFYRPTAQRPCVLIEKSAFPSDRYAICSQLAFHGFDPASHLIELAPRPGECCLRTEDLIDTIEREGSRLALVLLPGVQYLTGQALDLAAIAAAARAAGAVIGLDLAHAIGNTPLELHDWNVDFAVWCGYKYLNGGPGAIGGCFVHARHGAMPAAPRFAGWWGHDKGSRFMMGPDFEPIPGAQGWQLSNPPVLSAAPLYAALDIFRRADFRRLRAKSIALTAYLRAAIERLVPGGVEILTPRAADAHGCQLSLRVPRGGTRCFERLTAAGIVGDWREPDVLRLAPVPSYNRFADALRAAEALAAALGG